MMTRQIAFCLLALAAFAIGCGESGSIIQGKVQFSDGSPLTVGELIFDDGAYSEVAPIDDQGNFTILKGMPDGIYKITIQGAAEGEYANPKPLVDNRYIDYGTTDLELTVQGSARDIVLTVDRAKKR
ncbi:hypothetical protein [Blastopirellula marina]|uniref:Carboxypeptidase regulatory-like domain-containing protein n=1 Tax=Blastopirellula marina TaxID=124 RepID=A0A2S8GIP6_9BACT|nr:hypothetical protein [Blastopirellula marina]PQO44296.1 hypothetical protein C5Y93_20255 [Blastopirellula marina]